MERQIVTKYNYVYEPPAEEPRENLVDESGAYKSEKKLMNYINNGLRVSHPELNTYDFESEDADDGSFVDPSRKHGYDLADALNDLASIRARVKARGKVDTAQPERKTEIEEKPEEEAEADDGDI